MSDHNFPFYSRFFFSVTKSLKAFSFQEIALWGAQMFVHHYRGIAAVFSLLPPIIYFLFGCRRAKTHSACCKSALRDVRRCEYCIHAFAVQLPVCSGRVTLLPHTSEFVQTWSWYDESSQFDDVSETTYTCNYNQRLQIRHDAAQHGLRLDCIKSNNETTRSGKEKLLLRLFWSITIGEWIN